MAAIYIVVTCDTKGHEADWLRNRFLELGVQVCLLDAGCLGTPQTSPDISREAVFRAAGTTHSETVRRGDRGMAVNAAARGAAVLVRQAFKHNELSGVIGLGGSAGTTIGTAAMRALPIGIPKIMLSTLTSGDVRTYVRDKDIVMWNPVVDIAGMNRISRMVLGNAAAAMAGMVKAAATIDEATERPLIAATMFGVTTPCVEHARGILNVTPLEECVGRIQDIVDVCKSLRDDVICLCHGGPIAMPEDAAYIIENVRGIDGFYGASSTERFPIEGAIRKQIEAFKAIRLPEHAKAVDRNRRML